MAVNHNCTRVHPDDLQRTDDMLGATLSLHGWRLRGDPTLHPGGCKVSADEGDLDASVATRWQALPSGSTRSGVMTTRLTRWLTTLDNFEAKNGAVACCYVTTGD